MLRNGAAAVDRDEFLREAEIMAQMEHPNVVRLVGVSFALRPWLAVLQFCQYGDLYEVLRACDSEMLRLKYAEKLSWGFQLASALEHVTAKGFVHLDVAVSEQWGPGGHGWGEKAQPRQHLPLDQAT